VGYEPAPDRQQLTPPNPPAGGQELSFNFAVRTTAGGLVIGYRIEIWHADINGMYDLSNPRPPTTTEEFWPNTSFYRTDRYIYNARLRQVSTVVPGAYFDASLGVAREPHLHVIIRKSGYAPLTTQVFLPRDPNLPPSLDPYYQPQNTLQPYIQARPNLNVGYFIFRIV
jgi:protocatechuate 3,4-dioxygenase beta subunit